MSKEDHWDTTKLKTSPIIKQLSHVTDCFISYSRWPTIADYQNLFRLNKLAIKPVPQSSVINTFEDSYEPRIYLKKELQTRTDNWHDFFNAMIWLNFPATKHTLNSLHYNAAVNRLPGSNRSKLENRITQFDECGAIIISSNRYLLDLIKNHKWIELFVDNKESFKNDIKCVIFGHALFEKALNPYIGMTCHCLLIEDDTLLKEAQTSRYHSLDLRLVDLWTSYLPEHQIQFNPLPLLGIPGYWPNQTDEFYKNTYYFR